MEATNRLAQLIHETSFEQLPPDVREYSKSLAMSALGAVVAGSALPAGRIIVDHVRSMGGRAECTVPGTGFRTSVESAALANGTFAHATEYEDDSMPDGVSAYTLFPPILALAEKLKAPGKAVVEAFVVGQEVQSRLGLDFMEAKRRGYLNLSLTGVLGAAAAAAKLLGLNVELIKMALSIAASQGCGILRQTGSTAHFLEMGVAGRNGVASALLAAEGFTGREDILEGPQGFCDIMNGGKVLEPKDVVDNWGRPFRVMAVGIKRYPCCYLLQRIIDGVIELKRTWRFSAVEVDGVEVEVNPMFSQIIKFPQPATAEEARFSLPHAVSVALLDDQISLKSYSDERVKDAACREVGGRVKTTVHDEWEWGPMTGSNPVTVVLKDGRKFSKDCTTAKGQPPDLLPIDDVVYKYRICTQGVLGKKEIDASIRLVIGLDGLDDVGKLMAVVAGRRK
ncbi:MAG: MmgE/PrpD family protein [Chloroflexota bacterium]